MKQLLLITSLLTLMACIPRTDSTKVLRVEENLPKVKLGMAKDKVRELVGEPKKEGTITYNNFPSEKTNTHLICKRAPCTWDVWALEVKLEDFDNRLILIFDRNTHRLTQIFRDEQGQYFRQIKRVKVWRF
jgi:hypothetical protein